MKKIIIALTCILAISCKKSSDIPEKNHVYVAGSESNGTIRVVKYWKNGEAVTLDNIHYGEATSIAIAGGDVYVSGAITLNSGTYSAVYWKNGQLTTLASNYNISTTGNIQVSGNDVYVSGYGINSNPDGASIGKTGRLHFSNQTALLTQLHPGLLFQEMICT